MDKSSLEGACFVICGTVCLILGALYNIDWLILAGFLMILYKV